MDPSMEIDDHIQESIDYVLGLPVSVQTLEMKLRVSEDARRQLCDYCAAQQLKMKEKDKLIECTRAEATMNAQALKKFVEENQKLASECDYLLKQCSKWERECSLYDHDRDALMEFGNEADQRAKEAENRVRELEEEVRRLSDELLFYKREYDMNRVGAPSDDRALEDNLLDSVLSTFNCNDRASSAHAFLEAHGEQDSCQELLKVWNCLKPSTQTALSLAADVEALEKDKEQMRINLDKAEEEVKLLFAENKLLDEEYKRLLRQYQKEKNEHSSGKQGNTASAKSNKRKSYPKTTSSPIKGAIDFSDADLARQPLSPLRYNSPDSRVQKKLLE